MYGFGLMVYVRRFRRCSSSLLFVGRAVGVSGAALWPVSVERVCHNVVYDVVVGGAQFSLYVW